MKTNEPIRVGHFFAGGGGGILASEILGHQSVLATDINKRRCMVVEESGWFPGMHVECVDVREFDPRPWEGRMDCVAAGFSCQDISCAGHGRGIRGERSGLVFELFQIIDVVRPSLVFLENSPRIRTKGRDVVVAELVARGYSWRDGTLAASHVGAGHIRNRWWLLAADRRGHEQLEQERVLAEERGWVGNGSSEIADALQPRSSQFRWKNLNETGQKPATDRPEVFTNIAEVGRQPWADESREERFWRSQFTHCSEETIATIIAARDYTDCHSWIPIDAGICGMVDGVANKMDRIKTCGDGQVPLQAALAWALLAWT